MAGISSSQIYPRPRLNRWRIPNERCRALSFDGGKAYRAGLITVAVPPKLQHLYIAEQPGLLTLPFQTSDDFSAILKDNRKSGILVGPGSGINQTTHDIVLAAAKVGRRIVLDADALTVFQKIQTNFSGNNRF